MKIIKINSEEITTKVVFEIEVTPSAKIIK